MLKKDTTDFLTELIDHNNREWFNSNKDWYDRARSNFEELVKEIIKKVSTFDPEIGIIEPKKCIFRIYRDVRFSLDKSPYKSHFGAVIHPLHMRKSSGYYVHISPEESFISCGHYGLDSEQLKKMRRGIYNDFEFFNEIINEKNFKKEFGDLYRDEDTLSRVPNGFEKDHPSAEYMKLKRFYVYKPLPKDILYTDELVSYIGKMYKIMYPMNQFLNDVLLEE